MTTSADPATYEPARSAAAFRAALVDAGLLVPTRVPGLHHHAGAFEDLVQAVEAYVAGLRVEAPLARRHFPPVLPREDFLRTDYLRSFPDLVGSVDVFSGDDRAHRELIGTLEDGGDWTAHLVPGELVLGSSVCHSLYGTLPTEVPAAGAAYECGGWSFRHEPSADPVRMQAFRMWEVVRIGTPAQALAHRDDWAVRARDGLARLGLPVRLEPANDPFFGRVGRMLAATQQAAGLKLEAVVDVHAERPTAIASANYHEDHFGAAFDLRTADGAVAHSACVGFGLERITLALLSVHGLDPEVWPGPVREALGC